MKIQLINENVKEIITQEEYEKLTMCDELLKACKYEASMDVGDLMKMYLVASLVKDKIRYDLFDAHLDHALGKSDNFPKIKKDLLHSLARVETYLSKLTPCVQKEIDRNVDGFDIQEKTKALIKAMRYEKKNPTSKGKNLKEAKALKIAIIGEINDIANGFEPQE